MVGEEEFINPLPYPNPSPDLNPNWRKKPVAYPAQMEVTTKTTKPENPGAKTERRRGLAVEARVGNSASWTRMEIRFYSGRAYFLGVIPLIRVQSQQNGPF